MDKKDFERNPKFLIIRILEACDAGCFMCSFRWSKDAYRYPVEQATELAKNAADAGIRLVRLTGGEPLLHEHIEDLISCFARQGLLTSIITNGRALSVKANGLAS